MTPKLTVGRFYERMRDLLQSTMGGSTTIRTRLQPDLWPAMIDPTQIELVILNLAIWFALHTLFRQIVRTVHESVLPGRLVARPRPPCALGAQDGSLGRRSVH